MPIQRAENMFRGYSGKISAELHFAVVAGDGESASLSSGIPDRPCETGAIRTKRRR